MRISDWSSDVCSSDLASETHTAPRPWRRGLLIGVPWAILAWGGYSITHRGSPALAAPPPPTVTIAAPLERAIDRWDDYVGRFEASKAVEVRPRVSGAITGVHFRDRAVVHNGPPLFTLDPRPFPQASSVAHARRAPAERAPTPPPPPSN